MTCPSCGSSGIVQIGTVDHLALTIWRCGGCAAEFTAPTGQPDAARARASRRLILNVDDRPSALYARNRLLRQKGFVVTDATTAQQAWDAAAALRPSLILLDVHLPDGDGREICRRMRRDALLGSIPIVLISSTLRPHEGSDFARYGASGFLREPVAGDRLVETIERVVAGDDA